METQGLFGAARCPWQGRHPRQSAHGRFRGAGQPAQRPGLESRRIPPVLRPPGPPAGRRLLARARSPRTRGLRAQRKATGLHVELRGPEKPRHRRTCPAGAGGPTSPEPPESPPWPGSPWLPWGTVWHSHSGSRPLTVSDFPRTPLHVVRPSVGPLRPNPGKGTAHWGPGPRQVLADPPGLGRGPGGGPGESPVWPQRGASGLHRPTFQPRPGPSDPREMGTPWRPHGRRPDTGTGCLPLPRPPGPPPGPTPGARTRWGLGTGHPAGPKHVGVPFLRGWGFPGLGAGGAGAGGWSGVASRTKRCQGLRGPGQGAAWCEEPGSRAGDSVPVAVPTSKEFLLQLSVGGAHGGAVQAPRRQGAGGVGGRAAGWRGTRDGAPLRPRPLRPSGVWCKGRSPLRCLTVV